MDEPQRAQRLDKVQLARVEIVEILVPRQQIGQLPGHCGAISGQQHPQVLHRRARPRVVEVDEVRTIAGPQHVARVAIAVQPQRPHVARAFEAVANAGQCHFRHRPVGFGQIGRQKVVREQEVAGLVAERRNVERGAGLEGRDGADGVQTADEPAHPFERRGIVQLRRAAAAFRVNREAEALEFVQCPSIALPWRNRGNFPRGELGDEAVLLEDLRIGPA